MGRRLDEERGGPSADVWGIVRACVHPATCIRHLRDVPGDSSGSSLKAPTLARRGEWRRCRLTTQRLC